AGGARAAGRCRGAAEGGGVDRQRQAAPLQGGHVVRLGAAEGGVGVPARARRRAGGDAGRGRERRVSGARRLLLLAMAAAIVGSGGGACGELTTIPAGRWRVTKGRLAGSSGARGQVTEAKFRAVAPGSDGNAA